MKNLNKKITGLFITNRFVFINKGGESESIHEKIPDNDSVKRETMERLNALRDKIISQTQRKKFVQEKMLSPQYIKHKEALDPGGDKDAPNKLTPLTESKRLIENPIVLPREGGHLIENPIIYIPPNPNLNLRTSPGVTDKPAPVTQKDVAPHHDNLFGTQNIPGATPNNVAPAPVTQVDVPAHPDNLF